jgi:BolA protein
MKREEIIREKLMAALNPTHLHVENQSHLHAGHAGDNGSGESHFYVEVTSAVFLNQSKVARYRIVHDILEDDLKHCIHALSLRLLSSNESA